MQNFLFHRQNISQHQARARGFERGGPGVKGAARSVTRALSFGLSIIATGVIGSGRVVAEETSTSNPAHVAVDPNAGTIINGDAAIFDDAPATHSSATSANTTSDNAQSNTVSDNAAQTTASTPVEGSNQAANVASQGADDGVVVGDGVPGDGTLDGVTAATDEYQHAAEQEAGKRETARRREENRRRAIEKQARIEGEMRRMMSRLGCDETRVQDAIIVYIAGETRARRPLRDQSRKLFQALRARDTMPNEGATDSEIETLLIDFRAALEQDKARHQVGEAALDQQINFKGNARLEAMLLLFGVIGDGPTFFPTREGAPQPQIQSEEKRSPTTAPSTTSVEATPNIANSPAATAATPAR